MRQRVMGKKQFGLNKKKLAMEMRERGINWSDLSRALGVSRQAIGAMLYAKDGATLSTIIKFADALGINYKELLL